MLAVAVQVLEPPWLTGLGVQLTHTLFVHVLGALHAPQLRLPPQPFEIVPQFLPCAAHVVGVQPHTFVVPPPPQVLGLVQLPQLRLPPQPFEIVPQFLP